MLKQNGCSDCERLWDDYGDATRNAGVIENKVQMAGLMHDSALVLALQSEVHGAMERRRSLRKQIVAHCAECHGQADAAAN